MLRTTSPFSPAAHSHGFPDFYQDLWTQEAPRPRPPIGRVVVGMADDGDRIRTSSPFYCTPAFAYHSRWQCDLRTEQGVLLATGIALSQEEAEAIAALSYVMAQGVSPLALLVTFHAQAVLTDDPCVRL